MGVSFENNVVPDKEKKDKISHALQRIEVDNKDDYKWKSEPDEIEILRKLTGGRSSSEVFEVIVKRGKQELLQVIKIGPGDDYNLHNEFDNYKKYLGSEEKRNAFFTPIQVVSPGLHDHRRIEKNIPEVIIYAHVEGWAGRTGSQTFEEIARKAVIEGDKDLEKVTEILETLFDKERGITNILYRAYDPSRVSNKKIWNHRLGPDGVIEVEVFKRQKGKILLTLDGFFDEDLFNEKIVYTSNITATESWKNETIKPGDCIYLTELAPEWKEKLIDGRREKCLVGKWEKTYQQFEIVCSRDRGSIQFIAKNLKKDSLFNVYGKIRSIRTKTRKDCLLEGLREELKAENGLLKGLIVPSIVPDPFKLLPKVLEEQTITSLVHGDLNPKNILIIGDNPYLIDYARTRKGEPLLSDFVRLEGCLARDILPENLDWRQHVRLQRLLAVACRLGDNGKVIERISQLLVQDRKELSHAFRLFYTIRKASKRAYPPDEQRYWYNDYLEQLFLFAHLMLKWTESNTPHALRSIAAIAGVASEALSEDGEEIYRWWSLEGLRGDGLEIIKLLKDSPNPPLSEIANIARGMDFWKGEKENSGPLLSKYELSIRNEYLRDSRINKDLDAKLGNLLLSEFEELRDVFVRNQETFINIANKILRDILLNPKDPEKRKRHEAFMNLNCEGGNNAIDLIAGADEVVLLGDAGGGKTTVVGEWNFLLAKLITGGEDTKKRIPLRLPMILEAPKLWDNLKDWKKDDKKSTASVLPKDFFKDDQSLLQYSDLLTVGALHISIDALNELSEEKKELVKDWIITLRKMYPRTPVLVCHRRYNYPMGFLPFPIITLRKATIDQIKKYVEIYLGGEGANLVRLLSEEPTLLDLARIPLFLWMLVKEYSLKKKEEKKEIPKKRGQLIKQFSRSYLEGSYHIEYGEEIQFKYSYAVKELLLGAIAYELFQQGDLLKRNIKSIVPKEISNNWCEILKEVIKTEMLRIEDEKLYFLHQSFQEYFTACHLLKYKSTNMDTIKEKIWTHGWENIFTILLGVADEWPDVINYVLKKALEVDPILTARFLRVAENVDPNFLQEFVKIQEKVLREPQSGSVAYKDAAQALTEYGQEQAWKILRKLAQDKEVPLESRLIILNKLTERSS